MRTTRILATAASLLSAVEGLALQEKDQRRQVSTPRVVSMDLERKHIANPVRRDRIRRRDAISGSLDNEETLYYINGTIGTPAQSVRLHLDTGSSDMWVNTPSSSLCTSQGSPCADAGTYTANDSSTYAFVGSWFDISYVDGSGASGDYVTDTFSFGTTAIEALQFGIGYTSSSSQGILGVGYEAIEVQVGRAGKAPYRNLPSRLVSDGAIQSNAYSLWLNDLDASTGRILFGGVDTAQYEGSLQTLPIEREGGGQFEEFLITLTGLSLGGQTLGSGLAQAVLLDSGSSLTYLPDAIVQDIYDQVDATYESADGVAYVRCTLAANDTSALTFTFTAPTIRVGMDELVLDVLASNGKRPTFSDGSDACLFGIAPAGSGTNVLGDTFLRSAYVVYDLANNQISLAQTRFNATDSSVKEITTGKNSVPDATLVTNAASATAGVSSSSLRSLDGRRAGASALLVAALASVMLLVTA